MLLEIANIQQMPFLGYRLVFLNSTNKCKKLMRRELKFKVWDQSEHRMSYWDGIYNHIKQSGGAIDLYFGDDQEMIMLQYIGLKDKAGNEIYEGDIVKISEDWHFRESELAIIEYHQYGIPSIVQRYLKNAKGQGDYNFDYIRDGALSSSGGSYYLVVGNIYENPELVKTT
jgi:uncharacterized phage protein (TIGR01671 family)